ncbi:MAG: hypothetical protein ACOCZR_03920, partial [Halanaerobiales bacterium]
KTENLITETEKCYVDISEYLPSIEGEIDETIEEMNLLLTYFMNSEDKDADEIDKDEGNVLRDMVEDLEGKLRQVHSILFTGKSEFDLFLSDGSEQDIGFDHIRILSKRLDEVLKNLRNLSFNSNIHAYKKGTEGSGFKVISEEINDIVEKANVVYAEIRGLVDKLEQWRQEFREDIETIHKYEETIKDRFRKELNKMTERIFSSLQMVFDILKNFEEGIEWAVEPVGSILELVQKQDIVKQNLENLVKIMGTSREVISDYGDKQNYTEEDILNLLKFSNDTFKLCSELTQSVKCQLQDSLLEISEKIEVMNTRINEVSGDNELVTDFLAGKEENNQGNVRKDSSFSSLDEIYEKLLDFVSEFNIDLDQISERYQNIIKKDVFKDDLNQVRYKLGKLENTGENLTRLKIYIKIELNRIDDNNKYAESFESIIDKFTETVKSENEVYIELSDKIESEYNSFKELAVENIEDFKESLERLDNSREEIKLTKDVIKDTVRALNRNINNLQSKVGELREELSGCKRMTQNTKNITSSFEELRKRIEREKDVHLSGKACEKWEKTDEELSRLVEEFTSYVERKTARETFADLDIDVGSEQGELTLFQGGMVCVQAARGVGYLSR